MYRLGKHPGNEARHVKRGDAHVKLRDCVHQMDLAGGKPGEHLGMAVEPDVLPLLRRVLAEGKGKDDVAVDRPLVLLHQHDRKVRGAEELPVVRSEQHSCADACRYRVLDDEIVGA